MRCFCCGKELSNVTEKELSAHWHSRCIKRFFGAKELPRFDLSDEALEELANQNCQLGYTVTGVQKKLSLHLSQGKEKRLTLVGYPSGFILKPQTEEYPLLPENEYMVMMMAKEAGIKTVPFALLCIGAGKLAYISKRIDRVGEQKLPMEDFCQLEQRITEDKYKGSYERCANVIERYSSQKKLDLSELFIRVVFSFLVGNSDMHLKNFSLISDDGEKYHLSEAYDMFSTKIVLDDQEELALTLNGKKQNLKRGDFIKFGVSIGLQREVCNKLIDRLLNQVFAFEDICNESYLSGELKEAWISLIEERRERLKNLE